MYSVIGFGVILNYFFHTRNFGMDPYGDYTIYMIDIFGSFEATLVAYLLGVLVVLTLGMQIGLLFFKLVESTHADADELTEAALPNVDGKVDDTAKTAAGEESIATVEIENNEKEADV